MHANLNNTQTLRLGQNGGTVRPSWGQGGPQGLPGVGSAAWTAATPVTTATIRQAPDGTWISSLGNRATRASFDATEQGFWSPVSAVVGSLEQVSQSASYARKDSAPTSLAKFGVLPANTAAQNVTGFTAAQASGLTDFYLPAGTYDYQIAQASALMTFTGKRGVRIHGDGAVLNDTTAHTAQAGFTTTFLFDNCDGVEVTGIKGVGIVLASPTVDLGYRGGTFVRAINGTRHVTVDAELDNWRYGFQTGDYADPTAGLCSDLNIRIRGTKIGYPIAAYRADGIRHDLDVDGVHRICYSAGCYDVRGVAKFKDQYIATIAYLITDCITSGTDVAAQVAPPANPTTSRGSKNIDVVVIDKGSTVVASANHLAGITLSRVDAVEFRNIKVRGYSVSPTGAASVEGGLYVGSDAKAVQTRYPYNWEPSVVLENIDFGGVVDHSASVAADSGVEVYVVTYDYISDAAAAHAATVRNFKVDGFTFLKSSVGGTREWYFWAPGITTPAEFKQVKAPGVSLRVKTRTDVPTLLNQCDMAELKLATPAATAGSAAVVEGKGTTFTTRSWDSGPPTNTVSESAVDVQVFTPGTSTWTKPPGAKSVKVFVIQGGAGGGSGRRGAAGTVRCGGGGGASGGGSEAVFRASDLPATVNVSVFAGGAGGAAVTANDTNGNAGSSSSRSFFGPALATAYLTGGNPGAGAGGTNATGTGGTQSSFAQFTGQKGASASVTGGAGSAAISQNLLGTAGGAGGAGGGITSGDAASAGGDGTVTAQLASMTTPAGGAIGAAGTAATIPIVGVYGPGAAGGGSSIVAAGGAGGAGVAGSGGGGGGASLNGNNSGAGGAGGDGLVVVTTYF